MMTLEVAFEIVGVSVDVAFVVGVEGNSKEGGTGG